MNVVKEPQASAAETTIKETILEVEADEARRQAILRALENVNRKGFHIEPRAIVKLMKPVTWFPPMWAFLCGAISTGEDLLENWRVVLAGLILAGPLMCAMSQTMNDYFDREVDAINEPHRPIPSGQISKDASWLITFALIGTAFLVAHWIHPYVLWISFASVLMSHAYSGPPLRAKRNGWFGNLIVGFAYEGVAWLTGSFSLTKGAPASESIWLAVVFSLGAHGIMTLNDFKSVTGDRIRNVRSIPVQLGEKNAAILAAVVMNVAQAVAIGILVCKGAFVSASLALLLLVAQQPMQRILIAQPKEKAIWYNSFGTLLYVMTMMISAIGIRP
ncbi:MAG: chlorophyll synthase ChlG [Chloroherpetonaceae bacterium]|nr:chlorophyll synthase ChlG [Chloroherpetonaceae bacterium]MDW8436551.1 chlorophyll synthase ChlG [Chloroherpetonaceae bacterium]